MNGRFSPRRRMPRRDAPGDRSAIGPRDGQALSRRRQPGLAPGRAPGGLLSELRAVIERYAALRPVKRAASHAKRAGRRRGGRRESFDDFGDGGESGVVRRIGSRL